MAEENKILEALTTLVDRASGKAATEKINWAEYKRPPVSFKVRAGYGVISDKYGNGAQETELFHLCDGSRGAQCNPIEGASRGPMTIGAHAAQISGGEVVLHQYTPYPQFRADGRPHVTGTLKYPHLTDPIGWQEVAGTFYNKSSALGAEWMRKAQAAANPPAQPQPTRENRNA